MLRTLADALRPTLLRRRGVCTVPSLRGLEEFFEPPPPDGEKVFVGMPPLLIKLLRQFSPDHLFQSGLQQREECGGAHRRHLNVFGASRLCIEQSLFTIPVARCQGLTTCQRMFAHAYCQEFQENLYSIFKPYIESL